MQISPTSHKHTYAAAQALFSVLLALLLMAGPSRQAQAAGTALDCNYTGSLYIYGPSTTIYVKPNTPVGEPIGSWVTATAPNDWRCQVTSGYQNDDVRGSVATFSPYAIAGIGTVTIDGDSYTVFNSVVKAGLGYVARFRATGAGFSTDWTPVTGTSSSNRVVAYPLLGPIPYNNGNYFTLGYELQIHFVKTATGLTTGSASAFDPTYMYTYRTYNAGSSEQTEVGRYRIMQFPGSAVKVQVMTQTCVTPDVNVTLPDVGVQELKSVGTVRGLTPFKLSFNNCPGGLSGINYKFGATTAILDQANGVTALVAGSDAKGVGVLLRSNSNTPIEMNTEYSLPDYDASGTNSYTVPMQAGIYQTENNVQSGSVKGAFTFTLIYK